MRHTNLCGGPRREPDLLWPPGRRARPPRRAASDATGLVPLGPAVVNGPHGHRTLRAPTIACCFASLASSGPFDQPDDENQNNRADEGGDQRADQPSDGDAKQTKQPAADQGADHADDDVADQPEPATTHNQSGEPARDAADHDKENETTDCHATPFPKTQPEAGCQCP